MNYQKYLNRIQYQGSLEPTLPVLQALQKTHLLHVPFENLDIHYNKPIVLDIARVFQKVIPNNRGGFCYELNGLFYELLKHIGFDIKRISARVFMKEKGYGPEYDHLAIIVKIDGIEYLADVGFGDFILLPLVFELGLEQNDPHGKFCFDKYDEAYFRVNKWVDNEWLPQYIFKDIECDYLDFTGMCHFQQTDPTSHFTQKRLISRLLKNGRATITGDILKIREGDEVQEIALKTEEDFKKVLWEYFQIRAEEI